MKTIRLDRSLHVIQANLGEAMFAADWEDLRLELEEIKRVLEDA